LAIWEGTTNVLSLDTLRAIDREKAFIPFMKDTRTRLEKIGAPELQSERETVLTALSRIETYAGRAAAAGAEVTQAGARGFSYSIARVAIACLMLEHAQWSISSGEKSDRVLHSAKRWCLQDLTPLVYADSDRLSATRTLALD
jgi:hypothetical protein